MNAASRLASLGHDFAGAASDVSFGFTYNPAGQIVSRSTSNDAFSWTGSTAGTTNSTANGLNQLSLHNGGTPTYDLRGNLATEGGRAMTYDSENRLVAGTAPQSYSLHYDTLGRFWALGFPNPAAFWDTLGTDIVAERAAAGTLNGRYVYGPGRDEVLVWYEGSGTSIRRWYHADERGSSVAASTGTAAAERIIAYDEYGVPSVTNLRFTFAGKIYLGGVNAYYNEARFYDPRLGRFFQTDPIGYGDGMNMYAFVRGDPVNGRDPSGLFTCNMSSAESRICDRGGRGGSYDSILTLNFYSADGSEDGGGGGSNERRLEPICNGSRLEGNDVTIGGTMEFYYGEMPLQIPNADSELASAADADYYLDAFNTSDLINGRFGRYDVDVDLSRGRGGVTAWLGDSNIQSNGVPFNSTIWLTRPTAGQRARDARLAAHELGHAMGNLHNEDRGGATGGLMDRNARGRLEERDVETFIEHCQLRGR
jgi:RHS repeat-associated protein